MLFVIGVIIIFIGFSFVNVVLMNFFNVYVDLNGINVWKVVFVVMVMFFMIVFVVFKVKGSLKVMFVVVGVVVGYLISILFGFINFSFIESFFMFSIFKLFLWGVFVFDIVVIVILFFVFMVSIIESVGDYYVIVIVMGVEIMEKYIGRGIGIEGLVCLIVGFFGVCGIMSYFENIGVVVLMKVGSRYVVQVGVIILIFFFLFLKFVGLFVLMLVLVFGGLILVFYGMISVIGFRLIKEKVEFIDRNVFILVVVLIVGFGVFQFLESLFYVLLRIFFSIFEFGMVVGVIMVIIFERIF